jgi:elongation factor Ts
MHSSKASKLVFAIIALGGLLVVIQQVIGKIQSRRTKVMVEISASMVKELRDKSGAAMMDCKRALVESAGDFDKAFELLRQKGVATAGKKADRVASEGLVVGLVSADGLSGSLVEVNCETDFVARNEQFGELTSQVAEIVLQTKPKDAEALLDEKHGSGSVRDLITQTIAKTGENILVRRLSVFEVTGENGVIGLYVHTLGGKMGALIEILADKKVDSEKLNSLGRELAMHVVSAKPQYLSREQIPQSVIENERRIESGKADLADKKPEMREKIVSGRVDKLLSERCLLDEPFVKDPSQTVAKYLATKSQEFGAQLKPKRFSLFILGEAAGESNGDANGKS